MQITSPAPKFVLEFTKMSGAGNDFIVIDNRFYRFTAEELSGFAARFCPRRTGVGADGLLGLSVAEDEDADYRMVYYNADGSLGTMCGNGARCLARFARNAGLAAEPLKFESDAGLYSASVPDDGSDVRLFVPAPKHFKRDLSLESELGRGVMAAHYLWTGTEHVVVFVDDVDSIDVVTIGSQIRRDTTLTPNGANVNFVQVESRGELKVRTFEKGVEAETLACGTGAIAASLVSAMTGKSSATRFAVAMRGGTLFVGFEGSADDPTNLYLEGAASMIYRATLEL
jgi:diaminopimelate epimerase